MEITEKSLKNILQEQREEYREHFDKSLEDQKKKFQKHVDKIISEQRKEGQKWVFNLIKDSHEKFMKIVGRHLPQEQIEKLDKHLDRVKIKLGIN